MRINAVNLRSPVINVTVRCIPAYLGVLGVHERFGEMEQDEVGVRHKAVSSHGRRINLKKCQGE